MGEILLLLGELALNVLKSLGITLAVNAATTYIQGVLNGQQGGSSWVQISDEVGTSLSEIENSSYGLNALAALIAAARTDILAAVGSPQQTASPVTLPALAPTGFLSSDEQTISDAVWNQIPTTFPRTMGGALVQVAQSTGFNNYVTLPFSSGIFAINNVNYPFQDYIVTSLTYPTFDPSGILPGDTLLTCLTRQNPTFICALAYPPQTFVLLQPTDGSQILWITLIDDSGFDTEQYFRYIPASGPPARSTLGDESLLLSLIPLVYPP